MKTIAIERADDPRIAAYRDVRDRDLRGREDAFVAEGDVVVRVLIGRGRFAIRSVLASAGRAARLPELLAGLPDGVPVYVASQAVMDAIAGFPIHRGLLAIGARGAAIEAAALLDGLGAEATVVAAVGLANHDNVGGVFRNAAAFGADAVLLDGETCDPLYRKAIRVSVGGALVVPFARCAEAGEMIELLAARGFDVIALATGGDERIDAMDVGPRRALVLGAEGPGLPPAIVARARAARIEMAPGFDSLNVAVACGIALHAVRNRGKVRAP